MLARRTKPGSDEQGAEVIAIQGDGVRLVIDSRTADVGCRGMLKEFFFDGVPVEPGDGAQPPRDGSPGPAPGLQLPGERLDVGSADGEQGQGAGAAPGGELAQVQRIRLPGQAAVSSQESGEGEAFGVGEGGLDRGERGGWGGSGHRAPPGRAGTRRRWASCGSQQLSGTST